jgi:hypothetical protein
LDGIYHIKKSGGASIVPGVEKQQSINIPKYNGIALDPTTGNLLVTSTSSGIKQISVKRKRTKEKLNVANQELG